MMNVDGFLSKLELMYREIEWLNDENADLLKRLAVKEVELAKHVNKCLTCRDNYILKNYDATIGQGE